MKEDEPETNENEIDDEITILYDAMCEYTILDLEATLFHFHRPEYLDEVEDRVRSYFSVALQHCGHLDADHPVKYTGLSDDVLNDSSSSGKKKKVRGKDNKNEKAPKNEYTDEEKDEAVILENEVDLRDLTYCAVIETMQMLGIPERSRDPDPAPSTIYSPDEIHSKVTYLNSLVYPAQRTPEWYLARSKLFSASAISKLLTSIAQYNSLIFEKCNPPSQFGGVDTGPREALCPLTWGIKYEPLTAMVYEHLNPGATVRTTYGCIQHPVHSFIGASPDGIVVSPDSPKYGRMVEIKNIWNRAITGIPKLEYYVQMQFQMDVCELPACDFVETRFKEYGTAAECFADEEREREGAHCRGVILYFSGIVEPDPLQCMFDDEDNEDGCAHFKRLIHWRPQKSTVGPLTSIRTCRFMYGWSRGRWMRTLPNSEPSARTRTNCARYPTGTWTSTRVCRWTTTPSGSRRSSPPFAARGRT